MMAYALSWHFMGYHFPGLPSMVPPWWYMRFYGAFMNSQISWRFHGFPYFMVLSWIPIFHGALMDLHDAWMVPPWCFRGLPWCLHGASMVRSFVDLHGASTCMVRPRCVHDAVVDFHGVSTVLPRRLHGAFIALPWSFHGTFMTPMVRPWRFHGTFMGSHGVAVVRSRGFHCL